MIVILPAMQFLLLYTTNFLFDVQSEKSVICTMERVTWSSEVQSDTRSPGCTMNCCNPPSNRHCHPGCSLDHHPPPHHL